MENDLGSWRSWKSVGTLLKSYLSIYSVNVFLTAAIYTLMTAVYSTATANVGKRPAV